MCPELACGKRCGLSKPERASYHFARSAPCMHAHSRAFHLPGKLISSSVARYRRPPREAAHSYRTSSAFAEAADFVLSAEAPAFEVESAPLHADVRGRGGTASAARARGGARAASTQVRSLLAAARQRRCFARPWRWKEVKKETWLAFPMYLPGGCGFRTKFLRAFCFGAK